MAQVKLGDVAVESRETYKGDKSGMPIVGLEHITPGEVTLSNWDTDTDNTFTKRFRKGDMLFGRRRAYLKKAAQAPFDGICSGDITVIRAKEDLLLPELLPFIIQNDNLFDFAVGKSAGSLSPRVKWDNLKNYTFELPLMEEQKKLAEMLWSINDTLQAYQKLLYETGELVKAYFIDSFGDLKSNEKNWKKEPLQQYADVIVGYPFQSSGYTEQGISIVGGYNLMQGFVLWNESKHWPDSAGYERYLLQEGDIVMAMDRPWVGNGFKMSRIKSKDLPALLIQRTACIRARCIERDFLYAMLDSVWFAEHCHIKGSIVPHISNKDINTFKIFIPPVEMQKQFTSFVQQNEKAKNALQNAITSLQTTKCCILEGALGTGRKE